MDEEQHCISSISSFNSNFLLRIFKHWAKSCFLVTEDVRFEAPISPTSPAYTLSRWGCSRSNTPSVPHFLPGFCSFRGIDVYVYVFFHFANVSYGPDWTPWQFQPVGWLFDPRPRRNVWRQIRENSMHKVQKKALQDNPYLPFSPALSWGKYSLCKGVAWISQEMVLLCCLGQQVFFFAVCPLPDTVASIIPAMWLPISSVPVCGL